MAALSFREKSSDLRITELLEDDKIKISCEDRDSDFAYAEVYLDKEDIVVLKDWLLKQIENYK